MKAPKGDHKHRWLRSARRILIAVAIIFAGFWWWVPWEFRPGDETVKLPDSGWTWERLSAPTQKIVVITAHPDDSEFYIGGTLARLHEMRVPIELIVVTNGDKGYYPFEDYKRNAKVRQSEQYEVAKLWGATSVTFLNESDGRFEPTQELISRITEKLRSIRPSIVLTFDPEFPYKVAHGDHRKAGQAGVDASRAAGIPNVLCFATLAPNYTVDISRFWTTKLTLLGGHKSQFTPERMDQVEGMLWDSAESAGKRIRVELSESFQVLN